MVTRDEFGDPHTGDPTRLNRRRCRRRTPPDLILRIPRLIAYSPLQRAGAGDLIVTGTPSGVGLARNPPVFMKAGDVVEVEIDGIGVLRNRLEAEP